jgi:hypothetical protein
MTMKAIKWLSVLLIVAALAAGCREFTVFETPTPAKLVPISAAPPTAIPQAAVTDKLTIVADEVDALLENIYERVNPGVVNIVLSGGTGTNLAELGSGSGFVIDREGHIVTNNHVVDGAEEIDVTFWDGSSAMAKVVGTDPTVIWPSSRSQSIRQANSFGNRRFRSSESWATRRHRQSVRTDGHDDGRHCQRQGTHAAGLDHGRQQLLQSRHHSDRCGY